MGLTFFAEEVGGASLFDTYDLVKVRHGTTDGIQLYREVRLVGRVSKSAWALRLDDVDATSDAEHEAREVLGFHRDEVETEPRPTRADPAL